MVLDMYDPSERQHRYEIWTMLRRSLPWTRVVVSNGRSVKLDASSGSMHMPTEGLTRFIEE